MHASHGSLAHFSCTWNAKSCDVEQDFDTIFTGIGVCYTFNGGASPRYATEPGSNAGLSLVLNVEQYEYMRGPQNDAGIKVSFRFRCGVESRWSRILVRERERESTPGPGQSSDWSRGTLWSERTSPKRPRKCHPQVIHVIRIHAKKTMRPNTHRMRDATCNATQANGMTHLGCFSCCEQHGPKNSLTLVGGSNFVPFLVPICYPMLKHLLLEYTPGPMGAVSNRAQLHFDVQMNH